MDTTEEMRVAQFGDKLVTRLAPRESAEGVVYTLDLRSKKFVGTPSPRITVRDPADAAWPNAGRTTSDPVEAARWVRERYGSWLYKEIPHSASNPDGAKTFREGAEALLSVLLRTKALPNGEHTKVVPAKDASLISMIRCHVLPRFGALPMAALTSEEASKAADALQITKAGENEKPQPAAHGTKRRFLAALSAVWRYTHRYTPPPFAGARVALVQALGASANDSSLPDDSTEVEDWNDANITLGDELNGALSPEQVKQVLVAAMWMDEQRAAQNKLKGRFIANTAHAIATQIALGARIAEIVKVRYGHVMTEERYVLIHNVKVTQVGATMRAAPLADDYRPWYEELKKSEGESLGPNWYLIRTNPNGDPMRTRGALTTLANRMAQASEAAGVKVVGKATHGFRATFMSMGEAAGVPSALLQRYFGHRRVMGMSSDKYVRQLVAMMKPSHRRFIKLPSPSEVRELVKEFKPAPMRSWKERKKPQSRSKAAREERRRKGPRPLRGASLDQ